ncbi:MAG: hypothetical protein ACI87E_002599 [Mariniblastus sp.]|jgi:hypothetical protein
MFAFMFGPVVGLAWNALAGGTEPVPAAILLRCCCDAAAMFYSTKKAAERLLGGLGVLS